MPKSSALVIFLPFLFKALEQFLFLFPMQKIISLSYTFQMFGMYPQLNQSLFSVSQFSNSTELSLTLGYKSASIQLLAESPQVEIPLQHATDGLYYLDGIFPSSLENMPPITIYCLLGAHTPPPISNTELNHLRLSHLNIKTIQRTMEHSTGLLPMLATDRSDFCSACAKSHIKHLPMPHKSTPKDYPPLHCMQTDILGPIRSNKSQPKHYVHGYICVQTRYAIMHISRSKANATQFLTLTQSITDHLHRIRLQRLGVHEYKQIKLSIVQGDYENLYAGGSFAEFAAHLGITTRFSSPHNHAMNGKIENFWYTIIVMTVSALEYANISLASTLWIYALRHAIRIWNITVHSNADASPHELVTGEVPDLARERIWGCPVYFLKTLDEIKANKLASRAHVGINLGRVPTTKDCFYVLRNDNHKIYARRDIIFDEGWKHRELYFSQKGVDDSLHLSHLHSQYDDINVAFDDELQEAPFPPPDQNYGPTTTPPAVPFDIAPELISDNDDSDTASNKSDFDLDDHYEITSANDRHGYTRILDQINEDIFLVQWPDTNNITEDAINARLVCEPTPFEILSKTPRSNGNFDVSWQNTLEQRDSLQPADISKFASNSSSSTQLHDDDHPALFTAFSASSPSLQAYDDTFYAFVSVSQDTNQSQSELITPSTYQDVLNSLQKEDWTRAMDNEVQSLLESNTWHLVPKSEASNIITGKWVFKIKYHNGKFQKFKARYCARGFSQKKGIDYDEVFAPVSRASSMLITLGLANQQKHNIHLIDVKNAFVRAHVHDHNLYLSQPQGYERYGPNGEQLVCKLDKYLYGLLQASREFNLHLTNILTKKLGFTKFLSDNCLCFHHTTKLALSIYVDDIIATCADINTLNQFAEDLRTHDLPITIEKLEDTSTAQILGIEIEYNKDKGSLHLFQLHSIEKSLKDFDLQDLPHASTPMEPNWHPNLHPEDISSALDYPIRETIGRLNDYAIHTRPDIQQAVSRVQREMHKPTHSLVLAIKRIYRYLNHTKHFKLSFYRNPSLSSKTAISDIMHSYSDATWGVHDNDINISMHSQSGHIHFLFNTPISWKTQLQRGKAAQSSGEAEYIATYHALTEAVHLQGILHEYGLFHDLSKPLRIYTDSESCIGISKNPVNHKRNKHIQLKYHYVRQAVQDNELHLIHIPAVDNPADIFTKVLRTVKQFVKLRDLIFSLPLKSISQITQCYTDSKR